MNRNISCVAVHGLCNFNDKLNLLSLLNYFCAEFGPGRPCMHPCVKLGGKVPCVIFSLLDLWWWWRCLLVYRLHQVSSLEFVWSPGAIRGKSGTRTVQERRAPRMAYMQHPRVSSKMWFAPYNLSGILYRICSDHQAPGIIDLKIVAIC